MSHVQVTIDDCEMQTFRCGGKGGQNKDKRDTGVRIIHHPSGARGESREERTQLSNRRKAFERMCQTIEMRTWLLEQVGVTWLMTVRSTERIRTYHYPENRVTDHRTGKRAPLKPVLEGDLDRLR